MSGLRNLQKCCNQRTKIKKCRNYSRNVAHTVNQLAVKTMDRRNRERAKNLFQVKFDFHQDHYDRGDHYDETPFQSSDMYVWLVLVMGVFYTIPALQVNQHAFNNLNPRNLTKVMAENKYVVFLLQLVLNYERELISTGNQDLCFYNFQCARPVSQL